MEFQVGKSYLTAEGRAVKCIRRSDDRVTFRWFGQKVQAMCRICERVYTSTVFEGEYCNFGPTDMVRAEEEVA